MAIVKYKNQSGLTYAYESTSEWDPVLKQSRPKRKYLGRVDPETGEIIPTAGKRGRPKKTDGIHDNKPAENDHQALCRHCSAALKEAEAEIKRLEQEKRDLLTENRQLKDALSSIYKQAQPFMGQYESPDNKRNH